MADLPSPTSPQHPDPTVAGSAKNTMADFPSPPSLLPDRGDDAREYRPLSPLAIIGFCVAAFYAAIMIIGGITALMSRSPLVIAPLIILPLPILAAILCYLARLQIVRSEGTRAGMALANWGWWLSVVLGLSYAVYYFGTHLAQTNQADRFANAWLALIREGKMNQAFLLTQDPAVRAT